MKFPLDVSEKVSAFLGSGGVTHQIPDGNNWVETNCLEWRLSSFDLEAPKPSQSLSGVLEEIAQQASDEALYTKAGSLDENKYKARIMEAFERQKTPELHLEVAALQTQLLEFTKKQAYWQRTRKATLKKVRTLVQHDPVMAYWGDPEWEGNTPETIVVAPITDQFEILQIEQTNGANYGISNDEVNSRMNFLNYKYGIDILGATSSSLDFVLKRIPKGTDAKELGKWLLDWCPDLYEGPRSFPKGKVSLWWD